MTFNVGHVDGGTGAGRKRPLRDKPKPWRCGCSKRGVTVNTDRDENGNLPRRHRPRPTKWLPMNPGYLSRCPVCKQERP